jgi:hypothetical protein
MRLRGISSEGLASTNLRVVAGEIRDLIRPAVSH